MSEPHQLIETSASSMVELAIFARERERCHAVSSGDLVALDDILDEDLTHTHLTGLTQSKAAYIAGLGGRPRTVTRSDLSVQVLGEVAIMRGLLSNIFPDSPPDTPIRTLQVLQVWVHRSGAWRQLAFACSGPVGDPPSR